ncbi:ABC transporter permease [Tenacibaculum jejuense]|uniref:Efflux ABC transporter, permease n=1 Tax=Tenacibaculum jejuense TaxID=584609 RepID=A0A238U791_9FLAO|nr:ABC transporter permease [Tenacibaculum jejuense]SNR14250.1 Efflux ABC transporter, permease [Tenacibaculum jejuense]
MKWYLKLQIKMFNRHLNDFGVLPLLAYPILFIVFILSSNFIFYTLEGYGAYGYLLLSISVLIKLSEKKRNDFLKLNFTKKGYYKLRIIENLVICIPFVLYLVYQREYLFILYVFCAALVLSKLKANLSSNFVIPTPFGKRPFEFSVGFRTTFYMFPIVYWLTYKSIEVGNFNLGIFSLLLLFVTLTTYYSKMENEFYVWSFKYSAEEFLFKKIKIGVLYASILSLPISIFLAFFFSHYILIIIVFNLLCFLYYIQAIIAKYCDFPKKMNLPSSMIFAASLALPPFVLFTFGYFYKKSIQKLKSILHDKH